MAAAHWGQEEACKLLVENFANMEEKNLSVGIISDFLKCQQWNKLQLRLEK